HATTVEPGYFRTDFLDGSSLTRARNVIADYAETSGKMRNFAGQVNHKQPGDPAKLAAAVVRLAASPEPPVHLLLGNDTLTAYQTKAKSLAKEIEEWHDVITGTDHDDVEKQRLAPASQKALTNGKYKQNRNIYRWVARDRSGIDRSVSKTRLQRSRKLAKHYHSKPIRGGCECRTG